MWVECICLFVLLVSNVNPRPTPTFISRKISTRSDLMLRILRNQASMDTSLG
uniref:Uncharacterized protein n=1 Tax=Triticum urartu TaxID=4572 RepID=A0A8R7TUM0_TRIUA